MDGLMFDTEMLGYQGWKKAGSLLDLSLDDETVYSFRGMGTCEKREISAV